MVILMPRLAHVMLLCARLQSVLEVWILADSVPRDMCVCVHVEVRTIAFSMRWMVHRLLLTTSGLRFQVRLLSRGAADEGVPDASVQQVVSQRVTGGAGVTQQPADQIEGDADTTPVQLLSLPVPSDTVDQVVPQEAQVPVARRQVGRDDEGGGQGERRQRVVEYQGSQVQRYPGQEAQESREHDALRDDGDLSGGDCRGCCWMVRWLPVDGSKEQRSVARQPWIPLSVYLSREGKRYREGRAQGVGVSGVLLLLLLPSARRLSLCTS